MNLAVEIGKLRLKNPVIAASGTFGYGEEYAGFYNLSVLGAVVLKGISLEPMKGNEPPRICETPCGMLNAIGLQNVGLKRFLKEKLPFMRKFDTNVIANILGAADGEYLRLAASLDGAVDGIEMNVSCPNVKKGGIQFGSDMRLLGRLVAKVRKKVKNSVLIVKLSPNVADIKVPAKVAEDSGADAISLINTITGMAVDLQRRRPVLASITGGLSGPAIKPVALRMVWEAARAVGIPVIGMGGITTPEDALEFMLVGARAVAVGTANFVRPTACPDIISGIEAYMRENGIDDINDIVGKAS